MRKREEPDRPARPGHAVSHGGRAAPARADSDLAAAGRLTPAAVLALQRTAGNAAVVAMLRQQADEDRRAPVVDPGAAGMDRHTPAHRPTHVTQQHRVPVAGIDQGNGPRLSHPSGRLEQEAEADIHRVMVGPTPVPRVASVVSPPAGARQGRGADHAPGNPPGVIQRQPVNTRFTTATADQSLDLTEANYVAHVDNGIANGHRMAFIVNAILPYGAVGQIPNVINSILRGFDGRDRVGVVLGVNAREGQEGELDRALVAAQALIEQFEDIPVALVRSVFRGDFPYGTMRNEVLHSEECRQLTRAFAANDLHPYISVQDFDTGGRQVPSGAHVFDHFEWRMRGDEDQRMDEDQQGDKDGGQSTQAAQPMRPLLLTGGYRVTSKAEEELIAELRRRYGGQALPDELVELPSEEALAGMGPAEQRVWGERQQARRAFLNDFVAAVSRDMAARDQLARIHPLLPYAPEPNLLFDALPNLLQSDEDGAAWPDFPLAFGDRGAEFAALGNRINEFNAWELTRRYSSAYTAAAAELKVEPSRKPVSTGMKAKDLPPGWKAKLDQDREEIRARVRVEAENNRLGERGPAFYTDFTGAAIETDLSRLAVTFLEGKGLPQSHLPLTGVLDRFFASKEAKKGVKAGEYRNKYDAVGRYATDELLRPSFFDEDGNMTEGAARSLPKAAAGQLGNGKANSMGHNVSAALTGPFDQIRAGIPLNHQLAAAREMALSTPQQTLGRYLALLKSELERGTPMDGNCLYHAVNQARGGSATQAAAAALRQQVVNWALAPANLSAVTQYASEHGVVVDHLIATLVRNGNWTGAAGDLAPRMIAATLGITLVIHHNSMTTDVPPLTGPSSGRVVIALAGEHYSVHAGGVGTS